MIAALNLRARSLATPARASAAWTLGGVLLLALASHVAVPLPGTLVPATLQPQAVLLVAALWPRSRALEAVVAWLVAGFAGAPVFALGLAGSWLTLMPTAGYLLAYVPVAALLAAVRPTRPVPSALLWLTGSGLVLLLGAAWLALFVGVPHAVKGGVMPFVLGDTLKTLAALLVVRPWLRHRDAAL